MSCKIASSMSEMQGAVVAAFQDQEAIGGQLDGYGIKYACGMVSGGASQCEMVQYGVESIWKVYRNLVDHPEGGLRALHCVWCMCSRYQVDSGCHRSVLKWVA